MKCYEILQNSGDLHLHSRYSDGSLDVEYILYLAKNAGIGYVSITDHDYLDSFEEIKSLANRYKINAIFGAELSCMDFKRNRKVHVLCYNLKSTETLRPYCSKVSEERLSSAKNVVKSIASKYNFIPELVEKYKSKDGYIFETHILHALAECGYSNKVCGELFNIVFKGEDKINFKHNDVFEMLSLIREAGGKSVLAHPSVHNSFELLEELATKNEIDGVEVWHPKNSVEDRERLLNIVRANNLIATGGTDFHGLYNSSVVKIGDFYTPPEYLKRILS